MSRHHIVSATAPGFFGGLLADLRKTLAEAERLEAAHGEAALTVVRDRIAHAGRRARRRLYRLHDELARRSPACDRFGSI